MENQNNMKTELELSGLDPEELEFMDIEERKKVLRAAGLDPKSYSVMSSWVCQCICNYISLDIIFK